MQPSNYPPGVTGNEPQITGEDDDMLDLEGEECNDCPKYLVCRQCGEAFDSLDPAHDHQKAADCGSWQGWDIQPECVAM
jgi:hypothetical protein